jgi:hypothetical protein
MAQQAKATRGELKARRAAMHLVDPEEKYEGRWSATKGAFPTICCNDFIAKWIHTFTITKGVPKGFIAAVKTLLDKTAKQKKKEKEEELVSSYFLFFFEILIFVIVRWSKILRLSSSTTAWVSTW